MAVVLALVGMLFLPSLAQRSLAQAPPGTMRVDCTNPYSGTTWAVMIDEGRGTVDGFAAHLGALITWRDLRDGGWYRLNRRTGAMSVIFTSSTGGYTLYDHCRPSPGR